MDYEDRCQLICWKTARMYDTIAATITGSLGFKKNFGFIVCFYFFQCGTVKIASFSDQEWIKKQKAENSIVIMGCQWGLKGKNEK